MIKRSKILFLLILIIAGVLGAGQKQTGQQLYDLNLGKEIPMSEALTVLKQKARYFGGGTPQQQKTS